MKDFNWLGFKQGEFSVRCKTVEEEKDFLTQCEKQGLLWCSGAKPTAHTYLKDEMLKVIYFDTSCSCNHRSQLSGNIVDHCRELLLGKHRPGRTAGSQKERQLSGHDFFYIMMRLGNCTDICSQRHLMHAFESQFNQCRLDISWINILSKLPDKCRCNLRNDLASLFL